MEKRGNKIFKYSSGGLISCCAKPASCCAEHLLVSMRWLGLHWLHNIMINFSPPILEHFCLLFVQIAQMGLILPRWGLILPRIPHPTPYCLLSCCTLHYIWRYVCKQNTPKPTPKHPFPGLNLKVGKMNYSLGNLDPNWAIYLKSGKIFLEAEKKTI